MLYNRGILNGMITVEAIRYAIKKYGKKVTGEHVREGLEMLNMDDARLAALGLKGFTKPIIGKCSDHEGTGSIMIQEWDGAKWKLVSGWIEPMRATVRGMIEASAKKQAEKFGYTIRANCK